VRGEPQRLSAAGGDYVHIIVAGIFSGEGDPGAVGRECGIGLPADAGGQAVRISAIAVGDPKISGIVEGDLGFADGRLA